MSATVDEKRPIDYKNPLDHTEVPGLLLTSSSGAKNGGGGGNCGNGVLVTAGGAIGLLQEEFRWKDLFAEIEQRNEVAALMIYQSLPRDHLLEAQMEHFLETYIKRHVSPSGQEQLKQIVHKKLSEVDNESADLSEELVKLLPVQITDEQCKKWWKLCKFRQIVVDLLVKRYNINQDLSADLKHIAIIRAIHQSTVNSDYGYNPGCQGHLTETGPLGVTGIPAPAVVASQADPQEYPITQTRYYNIQQ